ncbi:MAG: hypothetical protein AAF715_24865 [Myxococcota bacterium]
MPRRHRRAAVGRARRARGTRAAYFSALGHATLCLSGLVRAGAAAAAEPPSPTTPPEMSQRLERQLDAKGAPALPGLTHRDNAFVYEYTVAAVAPTDLDSAASLGAGRGLAFAARWLLETSLVDRRWFIGVTSDVAGGSVPTGDDPTSGGATWILGNPEIWARGVWTSEAGLSAGGGLGLVVPVPRRFSRLEATVVRAVRVVRPWDVPHFEDLVFTARPWFDIRHVTGPVTLQLRQGLDVSLVARDLRDRENRYDLTAVLVGYVGVRPFDLMTLALEASEVYRITGDATAPGCVEPCDEFRAQFVMSPAVRWHLPVVTPTLGVSFPLSTPLRRDVAGYVTGRLVLEAVF